MKGSSSCARINIMWYLCNVISSTLYTQEQASAQAHARSQTLKIWQSVWGSPGPIYNKYIFNQYSFWELSSKKFRKKIKKLKIKLRSSPLTKSFLKKTTHKWGKKLILAYRNYDILLLIYHILMYVSQYWIAFISFSVSWNN